ncbi:hypothetical protein PHLGIDRAFT_119937 [Phlebiopsis gigantea 11061_1 CR5-6]|uniref:Cytochrome P450 n=1 Tax=Phlebiopsis gigantea (strain 11061_1 CR5-6) TaxID=745531 RepID=A0A0C3S4Z1_PHLG1|nr:hypothetical protein PHLGIDRAFT_119937 [Phlebiopsis gigantea 11061_1 CR5-6]
MVSVAGLAGIAAVLALLGRYVVPTLWRMYTSPLRLLPGPSSPSALWGFVKVLHAAEASVPQEQWVEQYGPTISFKLMFGIRRLWTVDTRALNHIIHHTAIYQKPMAARYHLSRVLGPGVLIAEDQQHKNQRHVLNPAFGPSQLKEITEIFTEKANQLRDLWMAEISKAGGGPTRVNGLSWMSRATLDIIGLAGQHIPLRRALDDPLTLPGAGFNYHFEGLNPSGQTNELSEALGVLFNQGGRAQLFGFLQGMLPPLRLIRTEHTRREAAALAVMQRIGRQLIAEKKAALLADAREKGRGVRRRDVADRDLLTLLIKANMATDIPESERLSDEEVLAQVPTFLVAGHETTSVATTWCLYQLTQSPDVQAKLREELLQVPTDSPSMDELNALPYLDMVVKETLRHHTPVPASGRVAMKDDVIPVNTPFTDKKGRTRDHIEIKKGDLLFIPIQSINRSKELWGEDAHEFKPDRWEHAMEKTSQVPGVWANQLTFLGGPHACIGYRFSVVETKALLFALVRAFEFELAVKTEEIKKKGDIVQRPVRVEDQKPDLPLLIKPYRAF